MQEENWKLRAREYRRVMYGVMAGALLFSAPALLNSQATSPLNINLANNRVGVNTPTPSEALDVNGNVKAANFIGNGAGLTGVASGWTKSGTNVNLSETGNVGVGTTAPGQKLDVVGNIRTTGVFQKDANQDLRPLRWRTTC